MNLKRKLQAISIIASVIFFGLCGCDNQKTRIDEITNEGHKAMAELGWLYGHYGKSYTDLSNKVNEIIEKAERETRNTR